jgi:S1-C subfamily serine protease
MSLDYDVSAPRSNSDAYFRLVGSVRRTPSADQDRSAPVVEVALRGAAESIQRSVASVRLREDEHAGAGFRVAIEGIVVTNAHTVRDADEVSVVLEDGTRRRARVLGGDPRSNTTALELADDSRLPPLHSGSGFAAARPGQPVVAVGSARGPRPSVISGA